MSLNFPDNPVDGQEYTNSVTGVIYTYRLVKDQWTGPLECYIEPLTLETPIIDNVSPTVSDVLTATASAAGGVVPYTYTYQWKRNDTSIVGATAVDYTVVSADIGDTLKVEVTVTDSAADTATATSNPTAAVVTNDVAPVIASVALTEDDPLGARYTSQGFLADATMTTAGNPAPDFALKGYVEGALFVPTVTDDIIDQSGNVLTFATDTDLTSFTAGVVATQDAPFTPVTSNITNVNANTYHSDWNTTQDWSSITTANAQTYRSGTVLDIFNPNSTGIVFYTQNCRACATLGLSTDIPLSDGSGTLTFGIQNPQNQHDEWTITVDTDTGTVVGGDYKDMNNTSQRELSVGVSGSKVTSINFNPEDFSGNQGMPGDCTVYYIKLDGKYLYDSSTNPNGTILTLTDNTQLNNFQVGDVLTVTNPGITVTGIDTSVPSMTVSGGTWTVGDTVTGPVIDGSGNVVSTNPSAKTITLDSGRFAIGTKVLGDIPTQVSKLYTVMNAAGQITDLVEADPGFITQASGTSPWGITFPALFPSGEAPDVALPIGTSFTVDLKATNTIGNNTKTSNIVIPAAANPDNGTSAITAVSKYALWNTASAAQQNPWTSIVGNGPVIVAVSSSGTNQVMYSSDGINWNTANAGQPFSWQAVCYGNGKFVAVSSSGGNNPETIKRAMYSTDGINWTAVTTPGAQIYTSVAYGAGKYVAVARMFEAQNGMMYSIDGANNWTSNAMPATGWNGITYGSDRFVAVGSEGVAYSTDGLSWNTGTPTESSNWTSVTYGGSRFVAVSTDGTNQVMWSTDGDTWTSAAAIEANDWTSITYADGMFVAVSSTGVMRSMWSVDGSTWAPGPLTEANKWRGITYRDKFIAVSEDGTNRVMWTEDPTLSGFKNILTTADSTNYDKFTAGDSVSMVDINGQVASYTPVTSAITNVETPGATVTWTTDQISTPQPYEASAGFVMGDGSAWMGAPNNLPYGTWTGLTNYVTFDPPLEYTTQANIYFFGGQDSSKITIDGVSYPGGNGNSNPLVINGSGTITNMTFGYATGQEGSYYNNLQTITLDGVIHGFPYASPSVFNTGGGTTLTFNSTGNEDLKFFNVGDIVLGPGAVATSGYAGVLYTGNSGTQTISGMSITPDLVWIKDRDYAYNHLLMDTVRGSSNADAYSLTSNSTDAQTLPSTPSTGLTAFNSDGFTLGSDAAYNNSGEDFVAWCFDAGDWATTTVPSDWDTSEMWSQNNTGFQPTIGAASMAFNGSTGNAGYNRSYADAKGTYATVTFANAITVSSTLRVWVGSGTTQPGLLKINGNVISGSFPTLGGGWVTVPGISSLSSIGVGRDNSGTYGDYTSLYAVEVDGNILANPWNQSRDWTENVSGTTQFPASNAFQGRTDLADEKAWVAGLAGQTGSWTSTLTLSQPLVATSSVEVWCFPVGYNTTSIVVEVCGITVTFPTNWPGGSKTVNTSGSSNVITNTRNAAQDGNNGGGVSAIAVDGEFLVNKGTIRAATLNNYDESQVWSSTTTPSNTSVQSPFAYVNGWNGTIYGDGNDDFAGWLSGAGDITITFPAGVTVNSEITVYNGDGLEGAASASITVGGITQSKTASGYMSAKTFSAAGDLASITVGQSTGGVRFYGLSIDGKILVDTGTTPPPTPSINSWVKADPTTGFSIVSYTGTGENQEVAHGLGQAPGLIVAKSLSNGAGPWYVYHQSLGFTDYLKLNDTSAAATYTVWPAPPTSEVFTGGLDSVMAAENYIAYCWAEKAGLSKISSYVGNGQTVGPVVECGFAPAFVMIKASSAAGPWNMYDTSRSPTNPANALLITNTADAETNNSNNNISFLSTGFQLGTATAELNESGETYIFMALSISNVVLSTDVAANQMTLDGGNWSNGDTVTGPTKSGTGTFTISDSTAKTITVSPTNNDWISNDNRLGTDFYCNRLISGLYSNNALDVAYHTALTTSMTGYETRKTARKAAYDVVIAAAVAHITSLELEIVQQFTE